VRAEEGGSVLELDASNFEQALTDNDLILVEFYAPWCGHCKRLEPEYEKAAQDLKGMAVLAKVNADSEENRPLANTYGIRGFPTLKLYRKGIPSDYEGERSGPAIVTFMKRQSRPSITALSTVEEVTKFSADETVVIIGFFANQESSEYETYKQTADSLRNEYTFGAVIGNSDVAKEFGAAVPDVILFKKFDEGKNILGASNFNDLTNFMKKNSLPLIAEIGPENYRSYAEASVPLAYLFVNPTVEGQKDTYIERVKDIAKESKGKINWVWIDSTKYGRHAEKLGLTGTVVPSLAIEDAVTGFHFAFDETAEVTTATVQSWIQKFLDGTLEPTIKSEPIPETNDGPVKTVVAKTFTEIVLDSTKDVLVEFYAPWCGHCKKLSPTWDELGTTLKSFPSVVIAKIDATANDVDAKLGIKGFPTIKFFPASAKESPIEYSGDRSLDDLINFVKDNASIKFDLKQKDEL